MKRIKGIPFNTQYRSCETTFCVVYEWRGVWRSTVFIARSAYMAARIAMSHNPTFHVIASYWVMC